MSLSHPKIEVSCIVIHEKEENTLNRVIYSNSIINTPIIVKMGVKSMKSRHYTLNQGFIEVSCIDVHNLCNSLEFKRKECLFQLGNSVILSLTVLKVILE